jgi:hypothetical protein
MHRRHLQPAAKSTAATGSAASSTSTTEPVGCQNWRPACKLLIPRACTESLVPHRQRTPVRR